MSYGGASAWMDMWSKAAEAQKDNNLEEAVKKWDQVITLLEASDLMEEEKEGDPSSLTGKLIVALGNAAGVYEQLKDYEEAESVLTSALRADDKLPPSNESIQRKVQLADVLERRGDERKVGGIGGDEVRIQGIYTDAINDQNLLDSTTKKKGSHSEYTGCLLAQRARCLQRQGLGQAAVKDLDASLAAYQRSGKELMAARATAMSADVLSSEMMLAVPGNMEKAKSRYSKAIRFMSRSCESSGIEEQNARDLEVAGLLDSLTYLYASSEQHHEALEQGRKAMALRERTRSRVLNNLVVAGGRQSAGQEKGISEGGSGWCKAEEDSYTMGKRILDGLHSAASAAIMAEMMTQGDAGVIDLSGAPQDAHVSAGAPSDSDKVTVGDEQGMIDLTDNRNSKSTARKCKKMSSSPAKCVSAGDGGAVVGAGRPSFSRLAKDKARTLPADSATSDDEDGDGHGDDDYYEGEGGLVLEDVAMSTPEAMKTCDEGRSPPSRPRKVAPGVRHSKRLEEAVVRSVYGGGTYSNDDDDEHGYDCEEEDEVEIVGQKRAAKQQRAENKARRLERKAQDSKSLASMRNIMTQFLVPKKSKGSGSSPPSGKGRGGNVQKRRGAGMLITDKSTIEVEL